MLLDWSEVGSIDSSGRRLKGEEDGCGGELFLFYFYLELDLDSSTVEGTDKLGGAAGATPSRDATMGQSALALLWALLGPPHRVRLDP
jgi:hypothetical protein